MYVFKILFILLCLFPQGIWINLHKEWQNTKHFKNQDEGKLELEQKTRSERKHFERTHLK